ERGLRLGAHDLLDDLTVLVDVHRRDLHDAVLLRHLRVLVDVELDDVDLVAVLLGDLLEDRRDHAARAAPLGPEVHEHGLVVLQDFRLEVGVGHGLHVFSFSLARGERPRASGGRVPAPDAVTGLHGPHGAASGDGRDVRWVRCRGGSGPGAVVRGVLVLQPPLGVDGGGAAGAGGGAGPTVAGVDPVAGGGRAASMAAARPVPAAVTA